jgi:hypothetical protein
MSEGREMVDLFSESKPNGWNSANGCFFANPVEMVLIPI